MGPDGIHTPDGDNISPGAQYGVTGVGVLGYSQPIPEGLEIWPGPHDGLEPGVGAPGIVPVVIHEPDGDNICPGPQYGVTGFGVFGYSQPIPEGLGIWPGPHDGLGPVGPPGVVPFEIHEPVRDNISPGLQSGVVGFGYSYPDVGVTRVLEGVG